MTPRRFGQHSQLGQTAEIRPFWAIWTPSAGASAEYYLPLASAEDGERRNLTPTANSPFSYETDSESPAPGSPRAEVGPQERRFGSVRLRHGHCRLSRLVRHLFDGRN